jgi:hypothetical protein
MGVEFIQRAAPTFKKSWDRGRKALGTADLFTRTPDMAGCSAAFVIANNARLSPGECVVVESEGSDLIARRGLAEVARADAPPAQLLRAVEDSCGVAKGTVEQIHEVAGMAEISLC